jgi:hypothetical protein
VDVQTRTSTQIRLPSKAFNIRSRTFRRHGCRLSPFVEGAQLGTACERNRVSPPARVHPSTWFSLTMDDYIQPHLMGLWLLALASRIHLWPTVPMQRLCTLFGTDTAIERFAHSLGRILPSNKRAYINQAPELAGDLLSTLLTSETNRSDIPAHHVTYLLGQLWWERHIPKSPIACSKKEPRIVTERHVRNHDGKCITWRSSETMNTLR